MIVTVQDRDMFLADRFGELVSTHENVRHAYSTKDNAVVLERLDGSKERVEDAVLLDARRQS